MIEILVFRSIELLGIILMSGGSAFLLVPNFYGFFVATPRHFWFSTLNYGNARDQALVRSTWLIGVFFLIIGATLVAANLNRFELIIFKITYLLIGAWIKAILFAVIVITSLWNWAVCGTPIFKKKEIQKGNT